MKKTFRLISLLLSIALMSVIFAGCFGDPDDGDNGDTLVPEGSKMFILEAEAMNLSEYQGIGYSGGGAGPAAIQKGSMASTAAANSLNKKDSDGKDFNEGFFVGFFNGNGTSYIFEFESDIDEEDCTMVLRLGSEHGNMLFNPSLLTIKVNGTDLNYNAFTVTGTPPVGGNPTYGEFKDYEISAKIDLVDNELLGNKDILLDGEVILARPVVQKNTVELILRTNDYWTVGDNPTGGPGIDCLKVITKEAQLSWDDYWNGGFAVDAEIDGSEYNLLYEEGYKARW